MIADIVAAELSVPLIHIIDVTAAALLAACFKRLLLLATRYTMEQPFYCDRLRQRSGLSPVISGEGERGRIHNVIFDELCCGTVPDLSRHEIIDMIARGRTGAPTPSAAQRLASHRPGTFRITGVLFGEGCTPQRQLISLTVSWQLVPSL